ncbi:unnamed protein product [Strongylus vulgaris]|uniref:Uncharacterized protein n=1 Tax=Strongylus vulgaris TaxID=40348 RepID=A0A3P7JIS8_STRVU|nr:unnamed protein product [Strongylus vulgaris]
MNYVSVFYVFDFATAVPTNIAFQSKSMDGPPPSPKESRVSQLEQRVRELEAMMVGQSSNNTALVIPVTPTQQSKRT